MKLVSLRTQSKRLTCLERVLIEQERQWDELHHHNHHGNNNSDNTHSTDANESNLRNHDVAPFSPCYNDEAIAAVCSILTKDCLVRAQEVAANDRREVEEFLRSGAEVA